MRKLHLLGLALFAVFAFGAIAASSALATEWLVGGSPAGLVLVDSEGELLLENLKTGTDVLCSGLNEGWVGGDATGDNTTWDEVTKIVSLAGTLPITCTFDTTGPCEAGSAPLAEADNLPWLTELLLDAGGEVLDDITGTNGEAGWLVECLVLKIAKDSLCVKNSSAEIDNTTESDVLALFSEAITGLATCTTDGINEGEVGVVEGSVLILTASGAALAVS